MSQATADDRTPFERLAALFRQRRFGEAMDFISNLDPDERIRLQRALARRDPEPEEEPAAG